MRKFQMAIAALIIMVLAAGVPAEAKEGSSILGKYMNILLQEVKGDTSELSVDSLTKDFKSLTENISAEDAGKIIDFVKEKVSSGEWDFDGDIEAMIAAGEKQFNVDLEEKDKKMIVSLFEKIKKMNIKPESLVATAEKLYEKYGNQLAGDDNGKGMAAEMETKLEEEVKKSISDYFSVMVGRVKNFFKGLFA